MELLYFSYGQSVQAPKKGTVCAGLDHLVIQEAIEEIEAVVVVVVVIGGLSTRN